MTKQLRYKYVPKTYEDNLLWRRFLWEEGVRNNCAAYAIIEACKRDPLFYVNSFVWTYDPRKPTSCLPFITYDFQDKAIKEIVDAIELQYDLLIEKSRDMGATWIVLVAFDFMQRFHNDLAFRCLSRKEEYVDKSGDPDTLFWKLDYIEERMPPFLACRGNKHDAIHGRSNLHIENQRTRSVIDGESANENACRAGRRTAILRDEEAHEEHGFAIDKAASDVTNCQIRVSTPNGIGNSFYNARHSGMKILTIHWSQHPEKAAGLYCVDNSGIRVIDNKWHEDNPGYPFASEPGLYNGLRSPWYDREWTRRNSKLAIAQELDIDYLGSGAPFFETALVASHRAIYCSPPVWTGAASELIGRDVEDKTLNPMSLWFHILPGGQVPQNDTYVIGVDISTGTGASDSAINITSVTMREKVGKYISNQITPESLADLVYYLAKWLTTPQGIPYLIWDQGGPGLAFGKRLVERHGWAFCYYHINKSDKNPKPSSKPGYPGTAKLELFTTYRAGLTDGEYTNRSLTGISELEHYVYASNGGVEHSKAQSNEDSSGNKANHGDEAYSDALAFMGLQFMPTPPKPRVEIPKNCWAYRRAQFHQQDKMAYSGMHGEHWE